MSSLRGITVAFVAARERVRHLRKRRPRPKIELCDRDIVEALWRLKAKVEIIGYRERVEDVIAAIRKISPDVIFNQVLPTNELEHCFAGALEMLELPICGARSSALALTGNKSLALQLLTSAGLPVPATVTVRAVEGVRDLPLRPPIIVKPSSSGSSMGINMASVAWRRTALERAVRKILDKIDDVALCQEFIAGREFKVGVVVESPGRGRLAGIVEWLFPTAPPGLGFKSEGVLMNRRWRNKHSRVIAARLSRVQETQLESLALKSTAVLGIDGYASMDVRMDSVGRFWIVEVNGNPALSRRPPVWARPDFDENIACIVRAAMGSMTAAMKRRLRSA